MPETLDDEADSQHSVTVTYRIAPTCIGRERRYKVEDGMGGEVETEGNRAGVMTWRQGGGREGEERKGKVGKNVIYSIPPTSIGRGRCRGERMDGREGGEQ